MVRSGSDSEEERKYSRISSLQADCSADKKENILDEQELLNVTQKILFPGFKEAAAAVVKYNDYD